MINYKKGDSALLEAIFRAYGGATYLHNKFFPDISTQSFTNWKLRGRVPLKKVVRIGSKLKIPVWGLNYSELALMYPKNMPAWKDVVAMYKLPKDLVERILFLKPPEKL